MNGWAWFVVGYLILNGLIIFGRGCAGSVRRYTLAEGIVGLAEVAVLAWIVAVKV